MKIKTLFLLFALFTSPAYAELFPNLEKGFRGLTWGTDYNKVRSIFETENTMQEGDTKLYKRRNETLRLSGQSIDSISYAFGNNKFITVIIEFSDIKSWNKLEQQLMQSYGKSENDQPDIYIKKLETVYIAAQYDNGKGIITLTSYPDYLNYENWINSAKDF